MSVLESETLREITPDLADGSYTILGTIKEGRLYLAEKAGKRFVLKTASGAQGLEMLKREYGLSLRLQHPFIAAAVGWEACTPVGPAIVMEYIRGRSLSAFLQEKPSLQARRRVFGQLLEAVGAMHRQSILHNDIKPDNILITEADNDVKLIDLGFADDDAQALERGLGGTRQYASPELLAHRDTDARSDIYSIGRLMQDLFPGRYGRIARKCGQAKPDRRYPSVAALEKAWRRRSLPWKVVSGLLMTGLLVWLVWGRPATVTAPSEHLQFSVDSLQKMVDSLQTELSARDRAEKEKATALADAKAKVEEGYSKIIPLFRKDLAAATTQKDATDAWMAFIEGQKKVNFDIPAATPEAVRPALRDYILQRNTDIQSRLYAELMERIAELPAE